MIITNRPSTFVRHSTGLMLTLWALLTASVTWAQNDEAYPHGSRFVLEARVAIGMPQALGETSQGTRTIIPITGGSFEGPNIKGVVVPGGADWQLTRPDGLMSITARYTLQAEDGTLISVSNEGLVDRTEGRLYVRTLPSFEAPLGPHDWLNKSIFLGTLSVGRGEVIIRVYEVL